jgi:hypothetical protein
MITIQAYSRVSARIDNTVVSAGSLERPINFEASGTKYDKILSVANATNTVIYTSTNIEDFEYLYIASDRDVRLLIGDTNSNTFSFNLRGTGVDYRYGVPFILGYNHTSDSGNTVNSITVFNESGNTAKVAILAID